MGSAEPKTGDRTGRKHPVCMAEKRVHGIVRYGRVLPLAAAVRARPPRDLVNAALDLDRPGRLVRPLPSGGGLSFWSWHRMSNSIPGRAPLPRRASRATALCLPCPRRVDRAGSAVSLRAGDDRWRKAPWSLMRDAALATRSGSSRMRSAARAVCCTILWSSASAFGPEPSTPGKATGSRSPSSRGAFLSAVSLAESLACASIFP